MEVQMQLGEEHAVDKVKKWVVSPDGRISEKYDDNLFLNSITYEVEFSEGHVKEYSTNLIVENMLAQVDLDGCSMTLMEGIINYQKDDSIAVAKQDKYIAIKSRERRLRRTTSRWHLLIKWRDGMESWVTLTDMKESHPVETA